MLRRAILNLPRNTIRTLSTRPIPPEHEIIRAFRQADYETAITLFSKRPPKHRSDALHEAAILACAQVPDAVAAQAILASMARPTPAAVASVVTALCRERDVTAAVDVLQGVAKTGVTVDHRLLASVSRALDRSGDAQSARRLAGLYGGGKRVGGPLSAAGFFVEEGEGMPHWQGERTPRPHALVSTILEAERALRTAGRDVRAIDTVWMRIQACDDLRGEAGVISACVHAYLSVGRTGLPFAINTLMTWVRKHLFDKATGRGVHTYTTNASAMALLVTATTKALAAAARTEAQLALSAYDILDAMRLPAFVGSLPLTGAYLKVLQHAHLTLEETRNRIHGAWEQHVQMDEQAFSMALGAILRCDARVTDKLEEGRAWISVMRSAGIPLTVHTYNLFAGQLRYCNDPQLLTSLLSDMGEAGVHPTAITYGLIFSACVMQGEYSSAARKSAMPVTLWLDVLDAMQAHMNAEGIDHTANSLLSLARAYAHLGRTDRALSEFETYTKCITHSVRDAQILQSQLTNAYGQMVFNFAHCRDCSLHGPDVAFTLFERMMEAGLQPSGEILDSLLVAAVRTGKAQECIAVVKQFMDEGHDLRVGVSGLKHLLKAHAELQNPVYWEASRRLVRENEDLMRSPELKRTVEELVVRFARCGRRDLCDELMEMADVHVSGLDFVLKGREFSRFRSRAGQRAARSDNSNVSPPYLPSGISQRDEAMGAMTQNSRSDVRPRSFHEPAFPSG